MAPSIKCTDRHYDSLGRCNNCEGCRNLKAEERLNATLALPEVERLREALADVTTHLIAATSAYETFSGNSRQKPQRDAMFNIRLGDFKRSIRVGRTVLWPETRNE